ncbi:MAG: DUF4167 domain-containing protein [Pseudolabrys sp.]|nr:DUF4167 domain-containing protein [Pseudolabrys sp.]MBV9954441.1 DUF4167 domain-containing protein [Pseudolabrys sp.]
MRNNQKRMRGRHHNNQRRNQNPLTRVYESNGPDVKIRGTASHIAEKYIQLARDAQGSGDPVAAENFYQHAEHYFRLIAAAQEQFRQQNPQFYNQQQPQQGQPQQGGDDGFESEDDEPGVSLNGQNEPFQPRDQQQNFMPQGQPYQQQQPQQNNYQQHNRQPQQQNNQQPNYQGGDDVGALPSFITGGQQPQQQNYSGQGNGQQNGQNYGNDQYGNNQDRFGGRGRHRRRHRGPRHDQQGGQNFGGQPNQGQPQGQHSPGQPMGNEGGDDQPPRQPGE